MMQRIHWHWLIIPIIFLFTQSLHADVIDSLRICGQAYVDSLMELGQTLARPTDLDLTTGTTHILVHYTTTGKNASGLAYAQSVAAAAESSWAIQVGVLGWHEPLSDGGASGDTRLDFFIRDTNAAESFVYQGVTASDPSGTRSASSYCTIAKWLPNIDRVRYAVAHEFNHACQNYYNKSGDSWFRENTSQWITKYTFPSTEYLLTFAVNNASFIESPLGEPFLPITRDNGSLSNYEYAGGLWPIFLTEWKDSLLVRRVWEMTARTTVPKVIKHIDSVLVQYYSDSLNGALNQYAIWRCFTGSSADAYHFKNASSYNFHGSYLNITPSNGASSISAKI